MNQDERPPFFVSAAWRKGRPEDQFSHPLNPNSELRGYPLGQLVGLQRAGVYLAAIPPGKESFLYHSHRVNEEWFFVLSGRAIADVDDNEYEVGPGDFMGFATPSVAHHLRNPFTEDFVYLSGGERGAVEIGDFPRIGKRIVIMPGEAPAIADLSAFESLPKKP
jgi:uncharacterized cupin superfamily protein